MATLAYRNAAHGDSRGLIVDQTDDVLVVRWPAMTTAARWTSVAVNLFSATTYVVMGGLVPTVVRRATGLAATAGDYPFAAMGLIYVAMAARELWVVYRWPTVTQTVTVTDRTVSIVRMGWWSPRLFERPLSEVADVTLDPIRRSFRSTADATRLTIRFLDRRRRVVLLLDSQWSAVNALRDRLGRRAPDNGGG